MLCIIDKFRSCEFHLNALAGREFCDLVTHDWLPGAEHAHGRWLSESVLAITNGIRLHKKRSYSYVVNNGFLAAS